MVEQEDLLTKFAPVLELNKNKKQDEQLAILYNICLNHIKSHHNHLPTVVKISMIYVAHRKYQKNLIGSDVDTINIIDDYARFYNVRIEQFEKDYDEFKDDVDKYIAFANNYLNS